MDMEPRIEAILGLLRLPDSDAMELIRHIAYILPLIKSTLNLKLLLTEIANCPALFQSIESTSYFIDAITAAGQRKKEISNPTISSTDFFAVVAREASTLALLPGLAILSGIALARPSNSHFITRALVRNFGYASGFSMLNHSMIVVCLAKAQWVLDQHTIERIPLKFYWSFLIDLVYPRNFDGVLSGPIFSDFGAYSQLMSKSLQCLPVLEPFLIRCLKFCGDAISRYVNSESTSTYKTLLFGVTLQMQGMSNQILHNRRLNAGLLCSKSLAILQLLGFVIEETGGSFEAYEFTYNICVDVLTESPRVYANDCIVELATWSSKDPSKVVDHGELLFFIELCEKLLPKLEPGVLDTYVLPIVRIHLKPRAQDGSRQLLEAAHSFMLQYLNLGSSPNSRNISPAKADRNALLYFDEVISLYPSILTWAQFKLALERITGALSQPFEFPTDIHDHILSTLFNLAKATMPGMPIPESQFPQTGERPPSLRAVYVISLLRALPDLCTRRNFGMWLQRINSMVPSGYSDLTVRERRYIKQAISDVVTSLNQHVADIGIRYWFQQGSLL